jgi:hypothetical protein
MTAQRITRRNLDQIVRVLNSTAGAPMEPYTKDQETGNYRANVGNYHLDSAYGGVEAVPDGY